MKLSVLQKLKSKLRQAKPVNQLPVIYDIENSVGSPQSWRTKAFKHSIQIIHNKDGKKNMFWRLNICKEKKQVFLLLSVEENSM